MKKLLVGFLFLALPAWAQYPNVQAQLEVPLNLLYNLTATSITYCNSVGDGGQVFGLGKPSGGVASGILVSTSGASTTVSAVTAGSAPFSNVAAGDILVFNLPGTYAVSGGAGGSIGDTTRVVTAKASNDSVTIDSNIDLSGARVPSVATGSGYFFRYRKVLCGTTANDGWVPTLGFASASFTFQADTLNLSSGGVAVRIECKDSMAQSQPVQVFAPVAYTVAGIAGGRTRFDLLTPWAFCRLGYYLTGTAAGSQSISTTFVGRK